MKEVEDKISARKAEVEKLIREMREANLESLAISPPEESKQFLDGEISAFSPFRPDLKSAPLSFHLESWLEQPESGRPTLSFC